MLPGPTNVPERVTRAMVTPSINHRSDDFVELYEECVNNTKKIFETEGDAVCLSASGTGATKTITIGAASGETLTVQEEGSGLATTATTMNFVGPNVTASGTGATKTIDIRSATTILDVEYNSTTSYRFTSHYGTEDNPTIHTKQGQTIAFNLTALAGSHPFALQTQSGAYSSGHRISTGLTHIATDGTVTTGLNAQGQTSGVLYFDVPHDQATIYYVCTAHPAMAGTLSVSKKEEGKLLQQVYTQTGTSATGTTIFQKMIQYLKIMKVMNI